MANFRLNFLVGLQQLTARYEQEVEAVQRVFTEVHSVLDGEVTDHTGTCVPTSYQHIQQRLDILKVLTGINVFTNLS